MTTAGLDQATKAALFNQWSLPGTMIVQQVRLLTLAHTAVSTITPHALDGQVNYKDDDGILRGLQMGFDDPDHALHLDAESPTSGVAGMNRLIQVNTFTYVDALNDWVGVPTFTGRPSVIDRDGDTVTVEAQSKECLHMNTVGSYQLRKGANRVAGIRYILEKNGERRFRFPDSYPGKLAGDVHIGGEDPARRPWLMAQMLARQAGLQVYYDGSGYACLRKPPSVPSWTLVEQGPGANLLSRIHTTTDLTAVRNRVVVIGHTVATKTRRSTAIVEIVNAAPSHELSPQSLAVNGVPWINAVYFDEPELHTRTEVRAYGVNQLRALLTESTDVQCKAVPVFHLEPGDLIGIKGSAVSTFRFKEGSVPLGPSGDGMTVGYQQRVRAPSAGRIRR